MSVRPSHPGMIGPELLEVLLALADGPRHGFGIVQAVDDQTQGRVSLAPSLLYRRLHGLRDQGLIADAGVMAGERGKPRKLYELTEAGRALLREEARRVIELAESDRLRKVLERGPEGAT